MQYVLYFQSIYYQTVLLFLLYNKYVIREFTEAILP